MAIPLIDSFNLATSKPIEVTMQVADVIARDAISSSKRWEGMNVYCLSEGEGYILSGGITNSDWIKIFPQEPFSLPIISEGSPDTQDVILYDDLQPSYRIVNSENSTNLISRDGLKLFSCGNDILRIESDNVSIHFEDDLIKLTSSSPDTSGLRFTNLTSSSPTTAGQTIGVDANGDVNTIEVPTVLSTIIPTNEQWTVSGEIPDGFDNNPVRLYIFNQYDEFEVQGILLTASTDDFNSEFIEFGIDQGISELDTKVGSIYGYVQSTEEAIIDFQCIGSTGTSGLGMNNLGLSIGSDIEMFISSGGNIGFTTTGYITIDGLTDYVNDAAAAIGGVPVTGLYHTAGVLKIRLS